MVVAHPDDEVIGAGAELRHLAELTLIHVTDGAPRNLLDASREGFRCREDYARARRRELEAALAIAGCCAAGLRELCVADQETSYQLASIGQRLFELFAGSSFEAVLTHPYEGGHPDHDATAFAVQAACGLLERAGLPVPERCEFTSYHNDHGAMGVGRFLPAGSAAEDRVVTVFLTPEEQRLKHELLACFPTQQLTLGAFPCDCERFRPAPQYDFTAAPAPGTLYYELFDWGITGVEWRNQAARALDQLRIRPGT
jgi:LmbE family N-acetylglucosaminyl deacetylase